MSQNKINETLISLQKETIEFFNNTINSIELQNHYEITNSPYRNHILSTIHEFNINPKAFIIKPFYELDYSDENVPRSLIISRNQHGLIEGKILNEDYNGYYIEPFRFISIITQLVEDEDIKKSKYAETNKESSMSMDR